MNRRLIVAVTALILSSATYMRSQNVNRSATVSSPASGEESWLPINKFSAPVAKDQTGATLTVAPPLTNVLNGVSFYGKKSQCNSEKVGLLKVINVNEYPVKLSWQTGPGTPVESVVIPARRDVEGACMDADPTRAKLVITFPTGPDKEQVKKFFFSSITVTESK